MGAFVCLLFGQCYMGLLGRPVKREEAKPFYHPLLLAWKVVVMTGALVAIWDTEVWVSDLDGSR